MLFEYPTGTPSGTTPGPHWDPFRYLVASESQQATIFPLLANVVQFTKPELEHIKRVREHQEATSTASGILSSFFLAPATDEQVPPPGPHPDPTGTPPAPYRRHRLSPP